MKKQREIVSILSIVFAVLAILCIVSYFLAVFGFFLMIAGLILAFIARNKNKSRISIVAIVLNGIAILLFLARVIMVNVGSYQSSHRIYEYYLPKKFSGWALIKINTKTATPIAVNTESSDNRYLIIFPDSGIIETSDALDEWHRSKYFWYDEQDTIGFEPETGTWGESNYKTIIHCAGGSANMSHFYVSDKPRNPQDSVIIAACQSF